MAHLFLIAGHGAGDSGLLDTVTPRQSESVHLQDEL